MSTSAGGGLSARGGDSAKRLRLGVEIEKRLDDALMWARHSELRSVTDFAH
jgi:hypothetical protein